MNSAGPADLKDDLIWGGQVSVWCFRSLWMKGIRDFKRGKKIVEV